MPLGARLASTFARASMGADEARRQREQEDRQREDAEIRRLGGVVPAPVVVRVEPAPGTTTIRPVPTTTSTTRPSSTTTTEPCLVQVRGGCVPGQSR